MKIPILFLLLIAAISLGAQKYVPFPTENAQWNIHYKVSDGIVIESIILSYSLQGDTIINEKSYKKLYLKTGTSDSPIMKLKGAIREENKRIYLIDFAVWGYMSQVKPLSPGTKNCMKQSKQYQSYGKEYLMYDFNKNQIGDTLYRFDYGYGLITAIDSIKIGNSYRKKYKLNDVWGEKESVVEGIGSVNQGLFGVLTPLLACMKSFKWNLVSFSLDNECIYKNSDYKDCVTTARWDDPYYLKTGTQWFYGEKIYPISGAWLNSSIDYNSLKSVGDTTINSHLCYSINHVRNRPTCYGYEQQVYVYKSNDTVYFQNSKTMKFNTLYVYGANQGDSWTVNYPQGIVKVEVDSISYLLVLGKWLKVQFVTYSTSFPNSGPAIFKFSSKIIEGIGDENYYFNSFIFYRPVCDDFSWSPDGLRCYVNPDLGTYHVPGTLDCAYVTEISKQNYNALKVNLKSSGIISVEGDLSTQCYTFELLDLKGSVMLRTTINATNNTINLSQYDKGLYLYSISANGALLKAGKIVKN